MTFRPFLYALYLLIAAAEPAIGDVFDDCNQSADLEVRVEGCTAIIESDDQSETALTAAYNNRGIALNRLGLTEEAIADYSTAISINPDYLSAYINRGFAYTNLPQFFLAYDDFNHVIAVAPGTPIAYVGRAYVELESGGAGWDAMPDLDRAIALMPNYGYAYYLRGNALTNMGERERAVADYNRAIALSPDLSHAYYRRGLTRCELGQRAEALADIEESWARDPEQVAETQNRLTDTGLLDESKANGTADDATWTALKEWVARGCPFVVHSGAH